MSQCAEDATVQGQSYHKLMRTISVFKIMRASFPGSPSLGRGGELGNKDANWISLILHLTISI